MIIMKIYLLVIGVFYCCIPIFAQNKIKNYSFQDLEAHRFNGVNANGDLFNWGLPDVKGKLTIIDFWNKSCSSCLTGMPKIHKLSVQFKDQLNVMTVTEDSREDVLKTFSRLRDGDYEFKLPTLYGDSIFKNVFGFNAVPYMVWIDHEGQFLASTNSDVVNADIIREVLNGNMANLNKHAILNKKQFYQKNVLSISNVDSFKSRPLIDIQIAAYNSSKSAIKQFNGKGKDAYSFSVLNETLYQLIKNNLFGEHDSVTRVFSDDFKNKRMLVSDRIRRRFLNDWEIAKMTGLARLKAIEDNNFCMSIISDKKIPLESRKKLVIQALESYFDISIKRTRRAVNVLTLSEVPDMDDKVVAIKDSFRESRYSSVSELIQFLNGFYPDLPIVQLGDEKLRVKKLNVLSDTKMSSAKFLDYLTKAGFVFIPEKKMLEVIVVD